MGRFLCFTGTACDFPGGPGVEILSFHCRGHRFDPWSGNQDPACYLAKPKKKKKDSSQDSDHLHMEMPS